jgi:hypothetical protein
MDKENIFAFLEMAFAMLRDWGSRDREFITLNRQVRERLVGTKHSSGAARANCHDGSSDR